MPLTYGLAYGGSTDTWTSAQLLASFADAKRLGVSTVRIDLHWLDVQPANSGQWIWTQYDLIVSLAQTYGLDVLFILDKCPDWAGGNGYPPKISGSLATGNTAFATFCGTAAAHYAPMGIHKWEIWNEPNIVVNWQPAVSASQYVDTITAAVTAIRAADASSFILTGGLSPASTPLTYWNTMITGSVHNIVDGFAYHPYTYPFKASTVAAGVPVSWRSDGGGTYWSDIPGLVTALTAASKPNMPIWITEFGAPTYGTQFVSQSDTVLGGITLPRSNPVSEAFQATIATDAVATAKTQANVNALFWYTATEANLPGVVTDVEYWFGLSRGDGTHKPAWQAYATAIAS